jgi:hypothetical protein
MILDICAMHTRTPFTLSITYIQWVQLFYAFFTWLLWLQYNICTHFLLATGRKKWETQKIGMFSL